MMPRKDSRVDEADLYPNDTDPAVMTAIARASEPAKKTSDEEKMHVFWRVFGGAILSIVALIGITLYNNVQSNITELRSEIGKNNEARGDFVRKDEFNTRLTSSHERISTLATQNSTQNVTIVSLKADLDAVKDRLTKAAAELENIRKDAVVIETLKEKLTTLTADLKVVREDALKSKTEIEKNQSADQERKTYRDTQAKEFEKTLKELYAVVQDCQVKLARIEGVQAAKPTEKPPEKPVEKP